MWKGIKWNISELRKMYSANETSYYSKKRVEGGFAFLILQWGLIHWMILNVTHLSATELAIWAGVECVICGYALNKIEQAKKDDAASPDNTK